MDEFLKFLEGLSPQYIPVSVVYGRNGSVTHYNTAGRTKQAIDVLLVLESSAGFKLDLANNLKTYLESVRNNDQYYSEFRNVVSRVVIDGKPIKSHEVRKIYIGAVAFESTPSKTDYFDILTKSYTLLVDEKLPKYLFCFLFPETLAGIFETKLLDKPIVLSEALKRYDGLSVAVDPRSPDRANLFMYNPETFKISSSTASSYYEAMPAELAIKNPTPVCRRYLPWAGSKVDDSFDGVIYPAVNTWLPPKWREGWEPPVSYSPSIDSELPEICRAVFGQMATEPMDYKYLIYWMYTSLTSRAKTFLVLQGFPGAGKSTFKDIMKCLHGPRNTNDGKINSLVGTFNSQIENCTYIHVDEARYQFKHENRFKELTNRTIPIEKKGQTTTNMEAHFSIALSNNDETDNYIHFESRKFAPITVASNILTDVVSEYVIEDFIEMITDVESDESVDFCRKTANYIFWYGKKYSDKKLFPRGEYKGPRFWHLCHTSLFPWQKIVADTLLYPQKSPVRELKKKVDIMQSGYFAFSLIFPDIQKYYADRKAGDVDFYRASYPACKSFLNSYRDLNGERCFEIKELEDSSGVSGDFLVRALKFNISEGESKDGDLL